MQSTELVTGCYCGVSSVGGTAGLVGEHPHDRVECAVALVDSAEMCLEHLATRHLLVANSISEFECTELPQLCHGPIMAHT